MKTIEVKTAELIGPALDWAVAKVECGDVSIPASDVVWDKYAGHYCPSTDWSQGGPLLAEYQLEFSIDEDTNSVGASLLAWRSHGKSHRTRWSKGPGHLIAACRAIVAAKLGDTVRVPAGLLAE